jgi:pilus assembly protein CpaE
MTQLIATERLAAVVALGAGVDAMTVEATVATCAGLRVTGFIHDLDRMGPTFDQHAGEVLVVACGGEGAAEAAEMVRDFTRGHPDKPVVVVCGSSPNGFVTQFIEAGADDIVKLPDNGEPEALEQIGDELGFAVQKALARKDGAALRRSASGGTLVCVLGPKGGIGKTLTASNLAVAFIEQGHSAAIVDLDLQFGDVGLALGVTPHKTIYDLARSSGSMDEEKVAAFMAVHDSGLHALLAPTRPDQASTVTPEFLTSVYATLRHAYDYIVVDTPPGFTPEVIASIDSASDICMVGMLDALSLKNTKLGLETLELMGYPSDRVRLVLNRADSRVGITRDDASTIVGRPADVLVPSSRDIARSVNESTPIVISQPRSDAARAFFSLASSFERAAANGSEAAAGGGRRRALFRRAA